MSENMYLVVFSDSKGNKKGVEVELPNDYSEEDVARAIWPSINADVKDRLLPDSDRTSNTPWKDQVEGYGYSIKTCSKMD